MKFSLRQKITTASVTVAILGSAAFIYWTNAGPGNGSRTAGSQSAATTQLIPAVGGLRSGNDRVPLGNSRAPSRASRALAATATDTSTTRGAEDASVTASVDTLSAGTDPGVAIQCRTDAGAFSFCTSPQTDSGLSKASHALPLDAPDHRGHPAAPPSYDQLPTTGLTISGDLSELLYPGAISAVNVRITNPFGFAISVAQFTVTPNSATTANGQANPACSGTANLVTNRQYTGPKTLTIAKNSTRSLSDLGVPPAQWPQLQMPNLPTNQDACKNTTFTFAYAANATKARR